jgi:hypothetical protein
LQILSLLLRVLLFFSSISILSSSPGILFSTCSILLEWLFPVFFTWFKELFISRISVWFFSLKFPYLCSAPLSYLMLSSLFHISFFIVSFVSLWHL